MMPFLFSSPPKFSASFRIACFGFLLLASLAGSAQVSVTTQHNDNARTGQNLSETTLTTSNVNVSNFGKLFFRTVDGYIFAQPLYVSGLSIGGTTRNVVFVATEHNSVYAFDADDPNHPTPLWHVNLGTPVPSNDVCTAVAACPYDDLQPEIGITSTPAIDLVANAIYVVSHTKNTADSSYHFWLHKLSLTTGADILSPVEITTTSPQDTFEPLFQLNRPGLLLLNNTVYVAFGSAGDFGDWHGWVMSYDATTLSQQHVFNATPSNQQNFVPGESGGGGIFSCGQGLVADTNGYIYFFTANGPFDTSVQDYSDAAIKLRASDLAFIDYFAPSDALTLGQNNIDLGAGGPLLIPNTNPGLLVGGGKDGVLRVLDTSNMGKFNTSDQVVQEWQAITNGAWIMGSPVYWDSPTSGPVIYLWVSGNVAKAWKFNGSTFQTTPVSPSGSSSSPFGESDTSPMSLSANGQSAGTGILWAPTSLSGDPNKAAVPGIFHALDAGNLGHELWNSQQNSARDGVGIFAKFTPPTVANGKVYLPTFSGQLLVYGLNPPAPSSIAYVQGTSNSLTTSSSQVTATYTSSQKAGDLNVVVVGWADTTSTIQSVTDTQGNSYSVAVPLQSSSSVSQVIYYAKKIVGSANTVMVKFNQTASLPSVRILEYSGADTSNPLDMTASAQGSGGTADSGPATTRSANELIFGADTVSKNTLWPGAPFISRVLSTASDMAEDHIVNVLDTYNATTSVSAGSNWVMQMATFKGAGQGSGNPAPTVTGISPTSGTSNGGTALTITGTGFLSGATVSLGGTAASGVTVVNSTTITATSPAHAAGAVNVVVTNTDGQSGTLSGGYTYTSASSTIAFVQAAKPATPQSPTATVSTQPITQTASNLNIVAVGWNDSVSTITSIADSRGNTYKIAGSVTTGTNLRQVIYYAQIITGGSNSVTVTFNQAVPFADVRVFEYSGLSTTAPFDAASGSSGSGATASAGPLTTASANELVFAAAMTGGVINSAGAGFQLRIQTPDGDIGEDELAAATGSYTATAPVTPYSGTSTWVMQVAAFKAAGPGSGNPAPKVTGISPPSGTINGGTPLTITGTGFLAGATASLGGTAATNVTVVNSTTITANSPAHAAGAVNVVVTNTDGQSGTLSGGYTYTSASSTIAFVQAAKPATPQSPTATVSTQPITQTASNLNIVAVGWNDSVSSITSISDTLHNTYNIAAVLTTGTNLRQVIYYAQNIAGGSNSVTVNFNQAVPFADVRVLEYSGLSTTAAFDAALGKSGSGATASAGPLTTASANELVFAAAMTGGVINSAGSGFQLRIQTPDGDIGEDELAAATGSYTATAPVTPYSGTSTWVMQMAAFKAGP